MDIVPPDQRRLRSCMRCSLIKSVGMFLRNGCDNCEEVLEIKGSMDRVMECTSPRFEGCIALMAPTESWVGKWQRLEKLTKGLYATAVFGELSPDVIDLLERRGLPYFPRDQSVKD